MIVNDLVDVPSMQTHAARIGDVILDLQGISLSFGGVKALSNISFDVREHEIRSIIGPNGAGKSSMLNVINGVYHPQQGKITFHGQEREEMEPHAAASQGTAPRAWMASTHRRTPRARHTAATAGRSTR